MNGYIYDSLLDNFKSAKKVRKRKYSDPSTSKNEEKEIDSYHSEPAKKKAKTAILDLTQTNINVTDNNLEKLKKDLKYELNETETEAAEKLFRVINSRNIEINKSFYKLLTDYTNRDYFVEICTNASVFFTFLNGSIKNTGVMTGMLQNKKQTKDFAGRAESELRYLAKLDTFRCFSSINHNRGLPKQAEVKAILGWNCWMIDGKFSVELLRTISLMYTGKDFPKHEKVEEFLRWDVWKVDGKFSIKRLQTCSSMYKGKGLPEYEKVKAILETRTKPDSGCDQPARKKVKHAALDLEHTAINGTDNDLEILKKTLYYKLNKTKSEAAEKLLEVINSRNIKIKPSFYKLLITNTNQDCFIKICTNASIFFTHANDNINDTGVITSMLQTKKHIEDFADRVESELRYLAELDTFHYFSSINHLRGLPKQAEVKAILGWNCWMIYGKFSV